ncbi:ATG4 [Lepeophtheirus salmonis]|uniref:Cysteine protease n=1 Tax=Lepeophtheirus salmonis TaxID=72036 RepID=A0A7R8CWA3_LEPSM|nr:ATG4 [Lepeophtheirus salmonis]CAF2951685.1 ATG4 [Lepeophtheirus salmonis]
MSDGAQEIKNRILSVWNRIKFGQAAWLLDAGDTSSSSSPVTLLARNYYMSESFARDFVSKLWLTYRREFKEFRGTKINSDCGWGCTIRSGQMLLGNALLLLHLGRHWRWERNGGEDPLKDLKHRNIIRLFADQEESPLSIHSLLAIARINLNRSPGEWFGPSSTSSLTQIGSFQCKH